MGEKKIRNRKRSIRRVAGGLLLALGGLLVWVALAIPTYIERHLNQYIMESSHGDYALYFYNIKTNLYTQSVGIDSVRLVPRKLNESHYSFTATKIKASGISVLAFLFHKKLKIKLLQIVKPSFEVISSKGQKRNATDRNLLFRKLHPFFDRSLKGVTIGEIRFEQAQLDHFRLGTQAAALNSVKNLDIGIINFQIDQTILSQHNEFFKADDIYLNINKFKRILGDSIHSLQVDELSYSIANKSINGKNFKLEPIDSTRQTTSQYWIQIPKIRLKSNDLRDILGNDSVRIDSVVVTQADIRLKPMPNAEQISFRKLKEYELYDLIRNDFNYIRIGNLELNANRLRFDSKKTGFGTAQEFKDVRIEATNFEIDSLSGTKPEKVLYADKFRLNIDSYRLLFNDGVHRFEAEALEISNADSLIKAQNLRLVPQVTTSKLPATVAASCDSVILRQVSLSDLFHKREMPVDRLTIYKPQLTLNQQHNATGKQAEEQSLLYHFIGDYIRGVYAKLVSIENGHVEFNDLRNKSDKSHIQSDFQFSLTNFAIDSVSSRRNDKLFYASNLELEFGNYTMNMADQLHVLQIEDIKVSSAQQMASISKLHLYPDKKKNAEEILKRLNRSGLYNIQIPSVQMRNTDIHHAFFRKKLNVNSFNISNPKIYIEIFAHSHKEEKALSLSEFYDLVADYMTDIQVQEIALTDGEFQFVNHNRKGKTINLTNKFSLNLSNFKLNEQEILSNRILLSERFDLKIRDHLFRLSDNVHFLKASEISFTSDKSSGLIQNALLYPDPENIDFKNIPWHIQIAIPRIELAQIDVEQAVFGESFDVKSVRLLQPDIQLTRNHKSNGKFNLKDLTIPLPEDLKTLSLGRVTLENGKLSVLKKEAGKNVKLVESGISAELNEAMLKRTDSTNTARFSSSGILTKLTDVRVTPTEIPLILTTKQIRYSSKEQKLSLVNLNVKNTGDRKHAIIGVSIPQLDFEQLDATEAFDQNRVHARRILINNPVFSFRQRETERQRNPLYIKLPDDLASIMDELVAGKVEVNNATFNIDTRTKVRTLDQVDIQLNDVLIDYQLSKTLFGAKTTNLVRRNLHYEDKQNLYNILIDRFEFNSSDNNLSLTGLHINPRFNQNRFQELINYQQDYYSGDVANVKLTNIDLDRWFTEHELSGKTIDIEQINMLIYRDKRKPANLNRYPPMPQQLVHQIELPFYFDSLKLNNSTFIYSEQVPEIPEPGRVSFEKTNARLYPFTNMKQALSARPEMILEARSNLMGASNLKAKFRFDMKSAVNQFEAKGSLSAFDLTAMNPITENGASISVRSGQLNRFDFEFSGDSVMTNGKLRFLYEDLKINILAHRNGNTKEARFLSFLANSLMLRSNSPRTKNWLPDEIYYRRDPNKSTLNYWWKSIFSGAKNSFGVKEEHAENDQPQ
ncbi:MAG: hypothetical protein ACK5JD_04785 [Mangrovibacterium sp.]